MKHHIKPITSLDYIASCLADAPLSIVLNTGPIKMYDYELLAKYLKTPTPLFRLDYHCFIHLTTGCLEMQINTSKCTITAPALILLNSGTVNALLQISKDIKGSLLIIENSSLNTVVTQQNLLKLYGVNPVMRLTDESSVWISSFSELLLMELSLNSPDVDLSNLLVQCFLVKAVELAGKRNNLFRIERICLEFKELLSQHFMNNKAVSFYAEQLSITENYLNRCVKKVLNKNAKTLIAEMWILQSQLLLQDLNMNISEIAMMFNFADASYFGRVFKKYTGQTPTQYRATFMYEMSGHS